MIVKCPKLSEELLNQKISTNHFENDCESRETTHLALDFGLFHTKNESTAESLPNLQMLDEGLHDFSCRVCMYFELHKTFRNVSTLHVT